MKKKLLLAALFFAVTNNAYAEGLPVGCNADCSLGGSPSFVILDPIGNPLRGSLRVGDYFKVRLTVTATPFPPELGILCCAAGLYDAQVKTLTQEIKSGKFPLIWASANGDPNQFEVSSWESPLIQIKREDVVITPNTTAVLVNISAGNNPNMPGYTYYDIANPTLGAGSFRASRSVLVDLSEFASTPTKKRRVRR